MKLQMRTTLTIIVSSLFLVACQGRADSNEIIIEGQVQNIPDGKLYLAHADNWQVPIDSTTSKNGQFKFQIRPDATFEPYLAVITYPESSHSARLKPLLYRNYFMGADSIRYFDKAFYVERGYNRIEGDNQRPPYLRVTAGEQSEMKLKNENTSFGWLRDLDSATRVKRLAYFKKKIKSLPTSYFLLHKIFENRNQYTEGELNEIIALFSPEVQHSRTGRKFQTYFATMHRPGKPFPNLLLKNTAGQKHYIIDSSARLNMIVFWASWCVYCRKEIPAIKDLYQAFKGKGLNLVSVSIDEDKEAWKKALGEEKMPWQQYLVDHQEIENVKMRYNFSSVPMVIFTDGAGKEIAQFLGYEKEPEKRYEAVIQQYIE